MGLLKNYRWLKARPLKAYPKPDFAKLAAQNLNSTFSSMFEKSTVLSMCSIQHELTKSSKEEVAGKPILSFS